MSHPACKDPPLTTSGQGLSVHNDPQTDSTLTDSFIATSGRGSCFHHNPLTAKGMIRSHMIMLSQTAHKDLSTTIDRRRSILSSTQRTRILLSPRTAYPFMTTADRERVVPFKQCVILSQSTALSQSHGMRTTLAQPASSQG